MQRAIFPLAITTDGLPDDEVQVRLSTAIRGRDGHILEPMGATLDNFRANPIVLWSHDSNEPIASASDVTQQPDGIYARVKFAPAGIAPTADRTRGLVKAGIVRGISIGFDVIDATPIDPARPRAGLHVTSWELMEFSFCSVPVDTGATVTARAVGSAEMDANAEIRQRMLVETPTLKVRGLYAVGELAWMLGQLGYVHESAVWEAEMEADNSQVPAMLGEALQQLGKSLIAMTTEEVGELLAAKGLELDDDMDALPGDERSYVEGAASPVLRAFRLSQARARLRAGRVLSQGNAKMLNDAASHMQTASDRTADAGKASEKVAHAHDGASDAHAAATTAHDKMGEAMAAAKDNPDDAQAHITTATKHHKTVGKKLATIGTKQAAVGAAQGDATDAFAGAARSMRAAQRSIRAVLDSTEDSDTKDVQTSDGTADSEGTENDRADRDYRRRQAEMLALADPP